MGLFDTISSTSSLSTASTSWSTTNDLFEEAYSRDTVMTTYLGISSSIVTGSVNDHKIINIEIAQSYIDSLSDEELAKLTVGASDKYEELTQVNAASENSNRKVLK